MTKTAEDIFRDNYSPSEPYGSGVNAMEEFAAQEVEAYKERLKADMDLQFSHSPAIRSVIKEIIDAVK